MIDASPIHDHQTIILRTGGMFFSPLELSYGGWRVGAVSASSKRV